MIVYNINMSSGIAFAVSRKHYLKIRDATTKWVKIATTDNEWMCVNTNLVEYIDIVECDDGCEE